MARVRHRKSINPFRLQLEIQRPDWSSILDPDKPVEIDLGFGRGEFILQLARRHPGVEYIGLEIRQYLIDKLQAILQAEDIANVHVFLANVKEHLPILFAPGSVSKVYIHFPDPWTKRKKHHKRRMVDASLVVALYDLLAPGGEVHLMTDKEVVGLEMRRLFETHGGYESACGLGQFCAESTTGIQTREEQYYLGRGDPVYRLKFVRIQPDKAQPLDS